MYGSEDASDVFTFVTIIIIPYILHCILCLVNYQLDRFFLRSVLVLRVILYFRMFYMNVLSTEHNQCRMYVKNALYWKR